MVQILQATQSPLGAHWHITAQNACDTEGRGLRDTVASENPQERRVFACRTWTGSGAPGAAHTPEGQWEHRVLPTHQVGERTALEQPLETDKHGSRKGGSRWDGTTKHGRK